MDNLNCKIQTHVRVSEANKFEELELEGNKLILQYLKTRRCKYNTTYNHYL